MSAVLPSRHLLCLALVAGLGGCASKVVVPPGTICEISGTHAPFYKYGPAQSFGADEVLPQGTRVTLIERGFGFSRVMRENGVTGYISTEDFTPLPPEKTKPGATAATGSKRRGSGGAQRVFDGPVRRSNVEPTPGDPLFDVNDVPLPVKDETLKPELRAAPPEQRPAAETPAPEKKN